VRWRKETVSGWMRGGARAKNQVREEEKEYSCRVLIPGPYRSQRYTLPLSYTSTAFRLRDSVRHDYVNTPVRAAGLGREEHHCNPGRGQSPGPETTLSAQRSSC
jgi:hypothetical protein